MRMLTIVLILLSYQLVMAKEDFKKELLGHLPKELTSLTFNADRAKVLTSFKSKVSKEEADAIYLNYFSKSNDVTIGFKKKHVSYIYIEPPSHILKKTDRLFERVYDSLSEKEQKELNNTGDDTLTLDLKQEGIKLEFSRGKNKTLKSIIFIARED